MRHIVVSAGVTVAAAALFVLFAGCERRSSAAAAAATAPTQPASARTQPISAQTQSSTSDGDEYAVYRAVLMFVCRPVRWTEVEVADQTIEWRVPPDDPEAHGREDVIYPEVMDMIGAKTKSGYSEELAAAVAKANRKPMAIEADRLRVPGLSIRLCPLPPYRQVPHQKKMLLLSRVGYSADRGEAAVMVDTWDNGMVYVLRRDGGEWKVVVQAFTWIS